MRSKDSGGEGAGEVVSTAMGAGGSLSASTVIGSDCGRVGITGSSCGFSLTFFLRGVFADFFACFAGFARRNSSSERTS